MFGHCSMRHPSLRRLLSMRLIAGVWSEALAPFSLFSLPPVLNEKNKQRRATKVRTLWFVDV